MFSEYGWIQVASKLEAKPGILIEHSNNLLINYIENDVDIGHGQEY